MRKFLTVIALIIAMVSQAQDTTTVPPVDTVAAPTDTVIAPLIDSSTIKVTVTLRADQVLLIFDCLEQKTPAILNLASQVAKQLDTASYDATQPITISVESGFVKDVYILMGVQQERFASGINDDIKAALLPQIMTFPWLIRELQGVMVYNTSLRQSRIERAYLTIKQMK